MANTVLWVTKPPDPYPFILLNLILSCLAALQAPVIMMTQNRLEARDRQRAEQDYQINLKAELEIRPLHENIDHLLHHHSERLLEIKASRPICCGNCWQSVRRNLKICEWRLRITRRARITKRARCRANAHPAPGSVR